MTGSGSWLGFLPDPGPTRPYLHDFLCYLPRLVDIQDDFGVPHHGVESPSFTQAGRAGKGKEELQTLLEEHPQMIKQGAVNNHRILAGFWPLGSRQIKDSAGNRGLSQSGTGRELSLLLVCPGGTTVVPQGTTGAGSWLFPVSQTSTNHLVLPLPSFCAELAVAPSSSSSPLGIQSSQM